MGEALFLVHTKGFCGLYITAGHSPALLQTHSEIPRDKQRRASSLTTAGVFEDSARVINIT